jgi:hypothetical protein
MAEFAAANFKGFEGKVLGIANAALWGRFFKFFKIYEIG